jgi:hypothetical protein
MPSQGAKKNKVLPVAVTEEDLLALDQLRERILFTPARSAVACGLLRYALHKVRRRGVSLRTISAMSAVAPIDEEVKR